MHLCLLLEAGRAGVSGELRASGSQWEQVGVVQEGKPAHSLLLRTCSITYTRPCLCTPLSRQL